MPPVESADQAIIPATSSEEKPTAQHVSTERPQTQHEETADPDAPVAMLLPGLSRLLTYNPPITTDTGNNTDDLQDSISAILPIPTQDLPDTTVPQKEFISPPSKTPNLLLTLLPLEIQAAIFAHPVLNLDDMMNVRRTCRTWRRDIPISVLDQKLRQQNYAGWQVVFEVNGKKYPGTTYGNRRLCGRCVVPKIRGNLVRGDCVGRYFSSFVEDAVRYKRIYRTDDEVGEAHEQGEWWEWPEDRGMCFPCLWRMLEENVELCETVVDSGVPGLVCGSGETEDGAAAVARSLGKADGDEEKGREAGLENLDIQTKPDSKVEEGGSPDSKKIWKIKLAAVEKKEQFTMMDGTIRKICDMPGCLRDIHENAVPCPHCTDFSKWIHRRRW